MNAEDPLRQRVARNVRRERKRLGLSQHELSSRSGISQKHISEIENALANVSVDAIDALARALGVPSDKFTRR